MNCRTQYFIWEKYAYFCGILIIFKLYVQNVKPKNPFGCCDSGVPMSKVIKVTNKENVMNFSDELREAFNISCQWGLYREYCDEHGEFH